MNRDFRFAPRLRTNIPPFASARDLLCIASKANDPVVRHALTHLRSLRSLVATHRSLGVFGLQSQPENQDIRNSSFRMRADLSAGRGKAVNAMCRFPLRPGSWVWSHRPLKDGFTFEQQP